MHLLCTKCIAAEWTKNEARDRARLRSELADAAMEWSRLSAANYPLDMQEHYSDLKRVETKIHRLAKKIKGE